MNWGQRVGKMNMKRNKVLKIGISLVTTAMMVIGTLSGIPMHAYATTDYNLWVGGYQFTSERLVIDRNVNGNFSGTATFAPATNTLTLNNFNNQGGYYAGVMGPSGITYTSNTPLIIRIIGENTITTITNGVVNHSYRAGIVSTNVNANISIIGNSFDDILNVYPGDNNNINPSGSDTAGMEITGNLLIKDCSVNVVSGSSYNSTIGIFLWGYATSHKDLTIDHASVTVRGGNLNDDINDMSGNFGIYCKSLTIQNESKVTVSAGTTPRASIPTAGIGTLDGITILNSKLDVASQAGRAISVNVKNDIPGKGWTDYEGTEGETPITTSSTLRDVGTYKKVHFAPVNAVTVTNGTCNGDGNYEYGDTVTITANDPEAGYAFNGWTTSSDVTFADANSSTTTFAMPAAPVSVTANYRELDRATVAQIPTAKTGLTVNGSAQALINGGSATGGTLVYALGNADSATGTYSETIPTEMNAGTYYVWYKAIGDSSHRDSIPAYVTVTISENSSSGGNNEGKSGDNTDPTENKSENGGTSKSQGVIMFRLYNPNSGEHFYTASEREKNKLSKAGWTYEGEGWTAPSEGDPVYRLYNKNAGDHHYTTSKKERDNLIKQGWTDEGIGWRSAPKDTGKPLYRLYNPNATGAGSHHYTTSIRERDKLVQQGWNDEGIAWYGIAE